MVQEAQVRPDHLTMTLTRSSPSSSSLWSSSYHGGATAAAGGAAAAAGRSSFCLDPAGPAVGAAAFPGAMAAAAVFPAAAARRAAAGPRGIGDVGESGRGGDRRRRQAAEARTCGQIVCVLARRSSDPSAFVVLYAAALALIAPWPLLEWSQTAGASGFRHSDRDFRDRAAPFGLDAARRSLDAAGLERDGKLSPPRSNSFFTGVSRKTRSRAGVLIYVSLAEHYARIIADRALERPDFGKGLARGWSRK